MKSEINGDFYCAADAFETGDQYGHCNMTDQLCPNYIGNGCCSRYHRKHPTPAQFREEYGEEVPDDMAVYYLDNKPIPDWLVSAFWENVRDEYEDGQCVVVVACTPFVPDRDWRPE